MPSLIGTTVAANYQRAAVVYPNSSITAASPYTQFGTRELVLLKATAGSGTPFATGNLANAGGDYAKAIQALQTVAEIYHVQRVSDTAIAFLVAADTLNDSDTNTNVPGGYGDLEAALGASVSGSLTFTVAAATIS